MANKKIKPNKKVLKDVRKLKSITVHGVKYKIEVVKKLKGVNAHAGAECDFWAKTIRITPSCAKNRYSMLWYILHEVKHASQRIVGLYELLDERAVEFDADNFAGLVIELKGQGII